MPRIGNNFDENGPIPPNKSGAIDTVIVQPGTGALSFRAVPATPGFVLVPNITPAFLAETSGGATVNAVTLVDTGVGLTGGPITNSGSIALADTAVTPGTYSFATVTVDQQGRITAAASGTPSATITLSGDASGSGTASIAVTLAATGVVPGSYNLVTVNAKGLVTAASTVAYLTHNEPITVSGDATGAGQDGIVLTLAASGVAPGTYNSLSVNAKGLVTAASTVAYLTDNTLITISGDASGTGQDSIALTLAATGVGPGTYNTVVVNAKGLVVSASTTPYAAPLTYDSIIAGLGYIPLSEEVQGVEGGVATLDGSGLLSASQMQPVTLTGDATGTGTTQLPVTLVNSGVGPGTYNTVTVNAKGLVTAASHTSFTLTGAVTGTGAATIATVLANSGVAFGTYNTVVVSEAGIVTAASNTPYLLGNQLITVSGDVTGSGATSLPLTLNSTGVAAGTYNTVTVNAKGLVVSATNILYATGNQTITLSGDASGAGETTIAVTLNNSGVSPGTYNSLSVNAKGLVTSAAVLPYLTSLTLTGDATGTGNSTVAVALAQIHVTGGTFYTAVYDQTGRIVGGASNPVSLSGDASGTAAANNQLAVSLANTGVVAGTYNMVTVNSKGLITAASSVLYATGNQTITLSGDASGNGTTAISVILANTGATPGTYNTVTINAKGLVTSGSNTAYLLTNLPISVSGDATGYGATSLVLTLANTGVVAGSYNGLTINAKGLITNAVQNAYLTANQSITLSGDASGSGASTIPVTLANTGVAPGTYNNLVVNSKGLVTSASSILYSVGNQTITISGDASGAGQTSIVLTLATIGVTAGTYNSVTVNGKGLVTAGSNASYLTTNQTVTLSGDVTGSGSTSIATTLANSGVTAGTYNSVTVNSKGLVTAGATTAVSLTATGDATGTYSAGTLPLTLASVGTAGTYNSVVTDGKGRVISGTQVSPALMLTGDVTGSNVSGTIATTLASTGVTAGTYSFSQIVVDAKGRVLSAASGVAGAGTVTAITAGTGLSGDTITTSGTIAIANTTVTAGTYSLPTITVNPQGQVTSASNGTNQTITVSGDASGSGSTAIALTLVNTGVAAGTYSLSQIVVDAKGRVLSAASGVAGAGTVTAITAGTGLSGGTITTSGTIAIANTTVTAGTYSLPTITVNPQGQVTSASNGTNQTITVSGDASGSGSTAIALTLANTGVAAGTYSLSQIVVDAKGRVLSAASGVAGSGGGITSITAGTGLSGGTITTSGTIAIANTTVTAGTYSLSTVVVNAQGQITTASNGPVLGTMATQNANAVAITGGTIDGTVIGGTTASTSKFTTSSVSTFLTFSAVTYSDRVLLNNTAASTLNNVGLGSSASGSLDLFAPSVTIRDSSVTAGGVGGKVAATISSTSQSFTGSSSISLTAPSLYFTGAVVCEGTLAGKSSGYTAGLTLGFNLSNANFESDLVCNPGSGSTTVLNIYYTTNTGTLYATPLLTLAPTGLVTLSGTGATATAGDNSTKVATTGFVQAASGSNLGRNLCNNARFTVQQRGAGPFTTQGVTLDRWTLNVVGDSDSVTAVTLADADRTAIADEYAEYSLQNVVAGSSTAANYSVLAQSIEDVRRMAGKTVTVSFWAKTSATLNIGVRLLQYFGTGGSPSTSVAYGPTVKSVTTTWTRYSASFALSALTGKTLGSNGDHATQLNLAFSSGSSNAGAYGINVQSGTFALFGVQIEVGSGATPLEVRDPRSELQAAQRFYQSQQVRVDGYAAAASSSVYNSYLLPVTMRATPSVTFGSFTYTNAASIATNTVFAGMLSVGVTAAAAGQVDASGAVALSAEI